MDIGMYELIEKILQSTSFIAIGGAIALVFFFIFAPSILGSKTIHKQLQNIEHQTEKMNEQLEKIARRLENPEDSSHTSTPTKTSTDSENTKPSN